jgi:Zn-dependent M28 family amino/carboxypeptidase
MTQRRTLLLIALIIILIIVAATASTMLPKATALEIQFNGEEAFAHVEAQMAFGPRPAGSDANRKTGDYILAELRQLGWQTETQGFTYLDTPVRNVIGKSSPGQGPVVIVGAHYDTRLHADQDSAAPLAPVPGANDGASGVAVLLELARALDSAKLKNEVWLAFFDAEDNGHIKGWEWIVGSQYMAGNLTITPEAMILADMIGDADQQIYYEENSDNALSVQLFQIAADLGYGEQFIPQPKYAMYDDHIPFRDLGIPAVDLIDFDYPYWHTTADTADKVSAASLERVGRVIEVYLEGQP